MLPSISENSEAYYNKFNTYKPNLNSYRKKHKYIMQRYSIDNDPEAKGYCKFILKLYEFYALSQLAKSRAYDECKDVSNSFEIKNQSEIFGTSIIQITHETIHCLFDQDTLSYYDAVNNRKYSSDSDDHDEKQLQGLTKTEKKIETRKLCIVQFIYTKWFKKYQSFYDDIYISKLIKKFENPPSIFAGRKNIRNYRFGKHESKVLLQWKQQQTNLISGYCKMVEHEMNINIH
eukprot:UN03519